VGGSAVSLGVGKAAAVGGKLAMAAVVQTNTARTVAVSAVLATAELAPVASGAARGGAIAAQVGTGFANGAKQAAKTGVPRVTEAGLSRIEGHLGSLNALDDGANQAMLARLQSGQTTTHDINFYMHELKESARMKAGLDYNAAHKATLEWQGIPYNAASPSQLYHPDVIRQFSTEFNPAAWPK